MNDALRELRSVVVESDISSFEVNHSGLIGALLGFLTDVDGYVLCREERLRWFIHIFADCPVRMQFFLNIISPRRASELNFHCIGYVFFQSQM